MASFLRICWNIFPILLSAIALCFSLLVVISGTSAHNHLSDIYFMRINTTNIIPASNPPTGHYSSVAQSIGLHDFYENSLWGYCEGDNQNGDNVTACSKPKPMYDFNIHDIFQAQLTQGQNVTIPTSIQDDFGKVHTASRWMFALYIIAVILAFLTFVIGLTTLVSRLGSVVATFLAFLSFLFIAAATILAQAIFVVYRHAINDAVSQLGVTANLGTAMFAFSWVAAVGAFAAFVGFLFGICCGTGDRRRRNRWLPPKASQVPKTPVAGILYDDEIKVFKIWGKSTRL